MILDTELRRLLCSLSAGLSLLDESMVPFQRSYG